MAIGSPLSLESTVSNGIVSGVRAVEREGKFVQITAPISPGSSGGPLFNMNGEVIGITTSGMRNEENLNFAIPINAVKDHPLLGRLSEARALPDEAYEAQPVPSTTQNVQNGPSLKETREFMQRIGAENNHLIVLDNDKDECSVLWIGGAVFNNSATVPVSDFAMPTDVRTDSTGRPEFLWMVTHPNDGFALFNLADIDPSTVHSGGAFSLENALRLGELDKTSGIGMQPNPKNFQDLTIIMFSARGDKKSIILTGDWKISTNMLLSVYKSKDAAERLLTAIRHAVQLCGGRPSNFAPTPIN